LLQNISLGLVFATILFGATSTWIKFNLLLGFIIVLSYLI